MAGIKFSCPGCGQHLEAPAEAAGCALACPKCNAPIRVPSETTPEFSGGEKAAGPAAVCAICQTPIQSGEARYACPACQAGYHADCWQENGGCAVYGCAQVPQVEQRRTIEIPISYWGQENKPCPRCNREILAAAMRCRFCGATFSSARPEDAAEFQDRAALQARVPGMKRAVVWIFILSVVPCCAPIGAIWGLIWFAANRRALGALPAMYSALSKLGLAIGIGQCVLVVIMAVLYTLTRTHV